MRKDFRISAYIYRLFHEDFSSIARTNTILQSVDDFDSNNNHNCCLSKKGHPLHLDPALGENGPGA